VGGKTDCQKMRARRVGTVPVGGPGTSPSLRQRRSEEMRRCMPGVQRASSARLWLLLARPDFTEDFTTRPEVLCVFFTVTWLSVPLHPTRYFLRAPLRKPKT
jgi:hypothetical protein